MTGHLDETLTENKHLGFLAFIRLVGTVYFKRHVAAFSSVYGHDTSRQLFNSVLCSTPEEHHQTWLEKVRSVVAERIASEEERVPSFTSLWRHWLRSCWISQMWLNSPLADLYCSLPPPEQSGWLLNHDGSYAIDWEEPEVQMKIKQTIDFLVKGCSCKRGCKSKLCGCRKKDKHCGPGCECQGCTNLPIEGSGDEQVYGQSHHSSDSDESSGSDYNSNSGEQSDSDSSHLEVEVFTDMDDFFLGV